MAYKGILDYINSTKFVPPPPQTHFPTLHLLFFKEFKIPYAPAFKPPPLVFKHINYSIGTFVLDPIGERLPFYDIEKSDKCLKMKI